jgi:hypothetical protein
VALKAELCFPNFVVSGVESGNTVGAANLPAVTLRAPSAVVYFGEFTVCLL